MELAAVVIRNGEGVEVANLTLPCVWNQIESREEVSRLQESIERRCSTEIILISIDSCRRTIRVYCR
jgi:hypothetical protein